MTFEGQLMIKHGATAALAIHRGPRYPNASLVFVALRGSGPEGGGVPAQDLRRSDGGGCDEARARQIRNSVQTKKMWCVHVSVVRRRMQ